MQCSTRGFKGYVTKLRTAVTAPILLGVGRFVYVCMRVVMYWHAMLLYQIDRAATTYKILYVSTTLCRAILQFEGNDGN